ncbi:MAG TPA: tRNA pseudouridine(55) synthase TruB [Moorella mulderi]|nr:tRNA pseudouridine(55) synthase TruB [Moorella mulderi]
MMGFINVLKPPGMTSHDVVDFLRRCLGIKKIGHGGTLDPLAAGVLPLGVGKATRLLEYVQEGDKAYRAEFILGLKTDTQDLSGEILSRREVPQVHLELLQEAAQRFTGSIPQVPPMASAVRYKGQRLYQLARRGEKVNLPPRKVQIKQFKILKAWPDPPYWRVRTDIVCSKGTYIRSLGNDWGDFLGWGATLAFLLRTRSGSFTLEESWTLEEIEEAWKRGKGDFLLSPRQGLAHLPLFIVGEREAAGVRQGRILKLGKGDFPWGINTHLRLETDRGQFLAVAVLKAEDSQYYLQPVKVLV